MGVEPKYRIVVKRAAQETWRIVIAHSWGALAYKVLAVAALIFTAWCFTQITPAQDDFVLTDQITVALVAMGAAGLLVFAVFLAQLLFIAPFQLFQAEWARAEAAEARCGELVGDGPIRDRTDAYSAVAYMIFGDWEHSVSELAAMDQIILVHKKLKLMAQDASDGHLAIWVRWERYGGSHVNPGSDYWGQHTLDWGDQGEGGPTMMAKNNPGISRLTNSFDPQVRKSDIERLYGPKR